MHILRNPRQISVIAALALLVLTIFPSFLAAQTGASSPPLTVSVLYNDKEGSPFKADWLVLTEIAKRKNMRFTVRTVPDGSYGKALPGIFASGAIPDLVLKVWPDNVATAGADGLLLPISDYEHLLPNYRRYIRENGLEEEVDSLRDENGKYYLLPGFQREIQVQQWIYRRDLFAKHGLRAPETYDELFQSLVTLKKLYPNSRPLSACWGGAHLFAMMGSGYGIPAGWNGDRLYDRKTDSWLYAPATKNWQEMIRFLARCYAAGILDPDLFTQDPDTFYRKLQNGTSFVTVTWVSSGFSSWNGQLEAAGIKGGEWFPLMVPRSTIGIQALPAVARLRKGAAISATVVRQPWFRRFMETIDWLFYSEEGRTLAVWGVEGVTYTTGAGGKRSFVPSIRSFTNPEAKGDAGRDYGLNLLFDLGEVPDFEDSKKPPEIVEFLDKVLARKLTERMAPGLTLSPEDIQTTSLFSGDLSAYVAGMIKSFVTGSADIDRDWKDYIATLEKKGARTMEKIWNEAWKTRKRR